MLLISRACRARTYFAGGEFSNTCLSVSCPQADLRAGISIFAEIGFRVKRDQARSGGPASRDIESFFHGNTPIDAGRLVIHVCESSHRGREREKEACRETVLEYKKEKGVTVDRIGVGAWLWRIPSDIDPPVHRRRNLHAATHQEISPDARASNDRGLIAH